MRTFFSVHDSAARDGRFEKKLAALFARDPDAFAARLPREVRNALLHATSGEPSLTSEIADLGDSALLPAVRARIRHDYVCGELVQVCGWRLSRTEAECLAIVVRAASYG